MHKNSVFSHTDYKTYLRSRAGEKRMRRGLKSQMAQAMRCQPTYVSQVLNGNADLSLEQSHALNEFFAHSADESRHFLLLVQSARAGSKELREYFRAEIQEHLARRLNLTRRLGGKNPLSEEQRSRYYSSWLFAAIHIALTIPELQTPHVLARHFRIPVKTILEVLEFLVSCGLARQNDGAYQTGVNEIRVGNDSALIVRHHTNWRLEALKSLDREQRERADFHYSGTFSISRSDVTRLKDKMLEWVRETATLVRESPEEELYAVCMDLFRMNAE